MREPPILLSIRSEASGLVLLKGLMTGKSAGQILLHETLHLRSSVAMILGHTCILYDVPAS